MTISVVTTMYRSAPYLAEFHQRVSAAVCTLTDDYEIVYVNDGSPDNSLEVVLGLFEVDPHIRIVDLSRNFGHHKAMMTGLDYSSGDLVFLLDCDLEEAPELLLEFHKEMERTGSDVVYGIQGVRKGRWMERLGGVVFYKLYNALTTDPIPRNLVTARLMRRRYVDALTSHREREISMSGLWATTGFHQVPYTISKASKGTTTYTFRKRMMNLVQGITSFSNKPLVYVFYLGCVIVVLSSLAALYLMVQRFFFGVYLSGWPSLIVSVWLLGGLTIFCLGIIGIYLSRIFIETKQRPYTIVRNVYERFEEHGSILRSRYRSGGELLRQQDQRTWGNPSRR